MDKEQEKVFAKYNFERSLISMWHGDFVMADIARIIKDTLPPDAVEELKNKLELSAEDLPF